VANSSEDDGMFGVEGVLFVCNPAKLKFEASGACFAGEGLIGVVVVDFWDGGGVGVIIGRAFIMSCKSLKLAKGSADGVGVVGFLVSRPAKRLPEEVGWDRGARGVIGYAGLEVEEGLVVEGWVFPEIALIGGTVGIIVGVSVGVGFGICFGICFVGAAECAWMLGLVGCILVVVGLGPVKIWVCVCSKDSHSPRGVAKSVIKIKSNRKGKKKKRKKKKRITWFR
jgi:hypothetical protein